MTVSNIWEKTLVHSSIKRHSAKVKLLISSAVLSFIPISTWAIASEDFAVPPKTGFTVEALESSPLTQEERSAKHFRQGRRYFEHSEWIRAESEFRESLNANGGQSSDSLFYLARTEIALNRLEKANDTLNRLEQSEGRSARLLCTRALAQFVAGDKGGAIETASAAIEKHPNHSYAHYVRGLSYLAINDSSNALDDFVKAESGIEDDFGTSKLILILNRAKALEALGRNRESLAAVVEGLAMQPESLEALAAYWHCQRRDGYSTDALETAKSAVEIHPERVRANQMAAISYAENDAPESAIRYAKVWYEMAPDSIPARRLLCQVYHACGDQTSALNLLDEFLAAQPGETWARAEKALILAMSSDTKESRQLSQELADSLPDTGELADWCWLVKAIAWLEDNPKKAAECLEKADNADAPPRHRHYLKQARARLRLANAKHTTEGI